MCLAAQWFRHWACCVEHYSVVCWAVQWCMCLAVQCCVFSSTMLCFEQYSRGTMVIPVGSPLQQSTPVSFHGVHGKLTPKPAIHIKQEGSKCLPPCIPIPLSLKFPFSVASQGKSRIPSDSRNTNNSPPDHSTVNYLFFQNWSIPKLLEYLWGDTSDVGANTFVFERI